MRPRSAAARARALRLGLLAAALAPTGLAGQVTEGPLAPAGRLRLEVAPSFFHWSERFGVRDVDGRRLEATEPLGFDLETDRAADLFPGVAGLEEGLRTALDEPAYRASLGSTRARVAHDVTRIPLRADLGVLDWLTVGVTVPFVLNRTEATMTLRPHADADLGLSPTLTAGDALAGFISDLAASAADAASLAADLCAAGEPGCAEAEALAADAEAFEAGLQAAYFGAPLFPAEGSTTGEALRGRLAALNERLGAAGLPGVETMLPLAGAVLDAEGFDRLFTDPAPALGAEAAPAKVVGLWELGDVELHAAVRLLEGERRDTADGGATARWEVGARGLVRLGTGTPDDPAALFDLGSGDGQTDVEAGVFANARVGSLGLWADVRYGLQRPVDRVRRIAPPHVVLAPAATRAPVRWTPGDYLQLELSPRWHLTTELAVAAHWRFFSKGEDAYDLVGDPGERPPLDPGLLEEETAATLHELGGGLVFSTLEAWREGRAGVPFEVRFGVQAGAMGSGGSTPKGVRVQGGLRLYRALWGGDPG